MWSVVDWSSKTWSGLDTWSEGVIDSRGRLLSNPWTSKKMRMIAQFVGEFHGCFLSTEECQDGFCLRPWWTTCSSLSQSLLCFFSHPSCPGLLTFPAFPIFQPASYLSFTQLLLPVLGAVSAPPQPAEPVALPQSQSLFLSPLLSLQGSLSPDTFSMTSHLCAGACFLCLWGGHLLLRATWARGRGMSKGQEKQTPHLPFVHWEPPWPPAARHGDSEERPAASLQEWWLCSVFGMWGLVKGWSTLKA